VNGNSAEALQMEPRFRELHGIDEWRGVMDLYTDIWGVPLVSPELLQAMSHAGGYVAGAFLGDTLAGACVGFLGTNASLHSHISGVAEWARDRGLGRGIKLHQREWALAHGLDSITWTFDPLISRNAHVNIAVLGALPEEYLADFYGEMPDAVNAGQPTDRLLVRWKLRENDSTGTAATQQQPAPYVLRNDDGTPVTLAIPAGATAVRVQVPDDVTVSREQQPEQALRWRLAVREALGTLLRDGWRVTTFDNDHCYVLEAS